MFFFFFLLVHCESFPSTVKNGLSKLGVPSNVLDLVFDWTGASEDYPKVPEAKGSIQAVRNEAFFIPLYELFLTYGGIFRLTFGPKVCCVLLCFILVEDSFVNPNPLKMFLVLSIVVLDRLGSFYR